MRNPFTPLDRRAFLKTSAGAGASLFLGSSLIGCASEPAAPVEETASAMDNVGVQLYTLREDMSKDFEGTIERVVNVGYKKLEFAGYYDRTPEDVRALLDRLGADAPSTHVSLDAIRADREGVLSASETVGHQYITVPYLVGGPEGKITADDYRALADEFNELGLDCQEKGMKFAYHNHAFEFFDLDGTNGWEILLENTDPSLVWFELDLFWTVLANEDPVSWFERYPGRHTLWHVKDVKNLETIRPPFLAKQEGARDVALENLSSVGAGDIDFARIFEHAELSGLEYPIVENDFPTGGINDIEVSYANMKGLLGA